MLRPNALCFQMLRIEMLRIGMLGTGEGHTRVVLRLHRCQAGASVLLRLQVLFGSIDRGLCCIQVRRCNLGRAGHASGRDRLTRVAHFLHGSAAAASQAGDADKYRDGAQHKGNGH